MRNQNRNRMALAALALIAALTAVPVLAEGGNGRAREIKDGVYSFTLGQGNYSMFVVGEDGVAVFDTFNSQHSAALLAAIRGVTDQPVKVAFHSHNHWDHASGGQVFKDAGAQTVMHARAAEWLAAHPGRDTAPPDVVWSGERHDVEMGTPNRSQASS